MNEVIGDYNADRGCGRDDSDGEADIESRISVGVLGPRGIIELVT